MATIIPHQFIRSFIRKQCFQTDALCCCIVMKINFLSLAALGMLINTIPMHYRLPLTQLVINNNYFQNQSFTITKIENNFVETVIIMCVVGGQQV